MTSPGFDQSSQPAVAMMEAFGPFSRWMWRLSVWLSGDAMGRVMESGRPDSWDITHAGVDSGSPLCSVRNDRLGAGDGFGC